VTLCHARAAVFGFGLGFGLVLCKSVQVNLGDRLPAAMSTTVSAIVAGGMVARVVAAMAAVAASVVGLVATMGPMVAVGLVAVTVLHVVAMTMIMPLAIAVSGTAKVAAVMIPALLATDIDRFATFWQAGHAGVILVLAVVRGAIRLDIAAIIRAEIVADFKATVGSAAVVMAATEPALVTMVVHLVTAVGQTIAMTATMAAMATVARGLGAMAAVAAVTSVA